MSLGLDALLEAAHFLEQQEKLKLSPQPAAPTITINEQRFFVQRPSTYDNVVVTTAATGGGLNSSNNNNVSNSIVSRVSSARHINSVSSSAPAGGATFHHANGLTITSSSNGGNTSSISQLAAAAAAAAAANHNSDYEFSNGNIAVGVAAAQQTANDRSSEGRINEDKFSSTTSSNTITTSPNNNNTNSSFVLTATKTEPQPPTTITIATATATQKSQQQQQQQQHISNNKTKQHATTFTVVDGKLTAAVGSAAASKQMLLNGGVRIASPAAKIGSNTSNNNNPAIIAAKVIAFSPNAQQQQQQLLSTTFPLYTAPNSTSSHALTLQRHKKCNPLTPPPMPSRKFVETSNTRIRSFSLSSNKFTAGAAAAVANNAVGTTHQQMMQQHTSEDSHMSYVSGSSSTGASPPRQLNGSGSHYIQMMSSGSAGSQGSQGAPLIGGSGRRRTISSNSNGAGTREVHNKLEKNRRAHLKECYEQLKNQLQLRDEDRKKTSNLAILGEAFKHVVALKRKDQELEAQVEQLAKEKINAQKKIVSLKRELGPKFEQYFASIMPDEMVGSIPVERENLNDSGSLSSSGRGSLLYSSSSSLSSGGSSNNTVSSPVGAGQLQTAMPTALSPVISQQKITKNSTVSSSTCVVTNTTATSAMAQSPISPNMLLQQMKSATTSAASSPLGGSATHGGSPAGSPTAVNNLDSGSLPLSLTAKNISATSLTRGSPTPSTPSPSPSSSSGVSSSSSIISSSPPMNGVINGRNVTVNIPNGLKFQTSANGNGTVIGTLSNGTAATIIGSAAGGSVTAVNSNNNATNNATNTINNNNSSTALNGQRYAHGRKTSLSIAGDAKLIALVNDKNSEDGEQPAKVIKVFNNSISNNIKTSGDINALQLSQVIGGGNVVVSPYLTAATTTINGTPTTRSQPPQLQKLIINGGIATSELGRLPGGAELNILPNGCTTQMNGVEPPTVNSTAAAATFFHANGKLTLVNGGSIVAGGGNNGILLKAAAEPQHHPAFSLSNGNLLQFTPASASTLHFGSLTPMVVATTAANGVPTQYTTGNGNFAQLLAAATVAGNHVVAPLERLNGKASNSN